MYDFSFSVAKDLFPSEALLKAAYSFIDRAYVHFCVDDVFWVVQMTAKGGGNLPENIEREFENELLAQTVRSIVADRTHSIREILMARAMTSTVIDNEDPIERVMAEQADISDSRLDEILKDWFERYD